MLASLGIYVAFVTFGIPNLPFQLASAAIYGLWPGFFLNYLGVNIGAFGALALARALGRKSLENLFGERLRVLNELIGRGGFRLLLLLRLIPLVPFNVINYAAGISRLRKRDYLAANLVGMIPITFIHSALGSAAATLNLRDPRSWLEPRLLLPLLAIVAMMIVAVVFTRRGDRSARSEPAP